MDGIAKILHIHHFQVIENTKSTGKKVIPTIMFNVYIAGKCILGNKSIFSLKKVNIDCEVYLYCIVKRMNWPKCLYLGVDVH